MTVLKRPSRLYFAVADLEEADRDHIHNWEDQEMGQVGGDPPGAISVMYV